MVHGFLQDSPGRGVELSNSWLFDVFETDLKMFCHAPEREQVRELVRTIDAEDTKQITERKAIKRRVYRSGIHFNWHMDGWHGTSYAAYAAYTVYAVYAAHTTYVVYDTA